MARHGTGAELGSSAGEGHGGLSSAQGRAHRPDIVTAQDSFLNRTMAYGMAVVWPMAWAELWQDKERLRGSAFARRREVAQ